MFDLKNRLRQGVSSFLFPGLYDKIARVQGKKGVFSFEQYIDIERGGKIKAGDYQSMVKDIMGWTYACINILSFDVAKVPSYIYKEKGKELTLVEDHPYHKLRKKPNPYNLMWELKLLTQGFLEATGSAYWLTPKTILKRPYAIHLLPSNRVTKRWDNGRFLYDYFNGKDSMTFDQDEIIHFKYPNLADINKGMGPVEAARLGINLETSMDVFQLTLFKNKARPDGVLSTKEEIDDDEAKRLKVLWDKQHKGIEKVGSIAVLGSGAEYKPITISPKDMEFILSQEKTMEKICAIFNVPPYKIGKVKDVNRANAHELEHSYQSNTISPRLKLRDEYETQIIKWYDDTLIIKSDDVVPRDKEFLLKQEDQDLKHAVVVINEVREKRGLEPKPWGDVPFLPMNMFPIGSVPLKEEGDDKRYRFTNAAVVPTIKSMLKALTKRQFKELYWKYYIRRTEQEERLMISKLQDYFVAQKKKVLANLKRHGKAYKQEELILFVLYEWDEKLLKTMEPLVRASVENGGTLLIEDFGLDITFDFTSPFVEEFFKGREKLIKGINTKTFNELKSTLNEGLVNGETIEQLRGRIEHVYKIAEGPRSALIARTEVNTANNFGHMESMRQAGLEKKEWVTAGDGVPPTRQTHMDNELQGCIGLNDIFEGTGEEYPGEPNCRCVVIPCMEQFE